MAGAKGRSGGKRTGSGRKKKSAHLRGIDGGASHSNAAPVDRPAAATKEQDDVPVPKDLFNDDLMAWEELAPLAYKERTLTPATAFAFSILCRNVVLMRKMYASPLACGGADHRDLIKQVNTGLLAFKLRPNGEPIFEAEPAKPESKLSKFRAVK